LPLFYLIDSLAASRWSISKELFLARWKQWGTDLRLKILNCKPMNREKTVSIIAE
jgi:hypothetical protein